MPSLFGQKDIKVDRSFSIENEVTLHEGDCLNLLRTIPSGIATLVVTSPPYNIGKEYEKKRAVDEYIAWQRVIIHECYRTLSERGSICWQVGNYVDNGTILPIDILLFPIFQELGLFLRNRIIWRFEHGLHASYRFSGRYETILWFTKSEDDYTFNLDAVRVPQKYPNKKYFKGPNRGRLSGNPLGKNPGDVWDIPNVKSNHIEKTIHPCQFPVGLIERLVLAFTNNGDLIIDPFVGVGTTCIAALRHGRRSAGAEIDSKYTTVARERIQLAAAGQLRTRPMDKPVYQPPEATPVFSSVSNTSVLRLFP